MAPERPSGFTIRHECYLACLGIGLRGVRDPTVLSRVRILLELEGSFTFPKNTFRVVPRVGHADASAPLVRTLKKTRGGCGIESVQSFEQLCTNSGTTSVATRRVIQYGCGVASPNGRSQTLHVEGRRVSIGWLSLGKGNRVFLFP